MTTDRATREGRDGTHVLGITLPGATTPVAAARLEVRGGHGRLVYDGSYLARRDAVPLAPGHEAALTDVPVTFDPDAALPGFLRDAAPDAWGRGLTELRLGPTDEVGHLVAPPHDRVGALGIGDGTGPDAGRGRDGLDRLPDLLAAADAVVAATARGGRVDHVHLRTLLDNGAAFGGARPKVGVAHDGALWIAKLPRPDDALDLSRLEHATLTLARACGLDAADSRLVGVSGRQVLLVRRFDRVPAEGGWLRHRVASALTVTGTDETGHGTWSYLDYADGVGRLSSRPRTDLRELFARAAFACLTGNDDDHPRNHAVLSRDGSWAMSPAYDLVPRPTVTTDRRSAMVLGAQGRAATRENLLSCHGRFELGRGEADRIVDDVVDAVAHGWEAACRGAGMTARDVDAARAAFLNPGFDWTDPRFGATFGAGPTR